MFPVSLFIVGGKTPDVQKMTYSDIMQQQELRREEVTMSCSMCSKMLSSFDKISDKIFECALY